jgi:hypothetical protein
MGAELRRCDMSQRMSQEITLSMPRTAPGEARIRARGKRLDVIAGDCVRSASKWRATLWSRAGQRIPGDEIVYGESLKELRAPGGADRPRRAVVTSQARWPRWRLGADEPLGEK